MNGKLIDVVGIDLKFKDTDNQGAFEFSADGFCARWMSANN